MKKQILLTLGLTMLLLTSLSFASPLDNYDQGNVAIDLSLSISPDIKMENSTDSYKLDAKNRLSTGITYGLGNKLAVQYKYADNKSKDDVYISPFGAGYLKQTASVGIEAHELNLLYQVNPNFSAFVGWTRATVKFNGASEWNDYVGNAGSVSGKESQSQNGYQVGVIGQTKLADNLTGWASLGAGNKILAYELGVGYDIAKNTELNLFYRHAKYKDFNDSGNAITKGLGLGVTLKF